MAVPFLKQQTYSFQTVFATLTGPGGSINIGAGAAAAEEGISTELVEETDSMKIGADGNVSHSLHAARAGKVTVRILKTSPVNQALMNMYNLQRDNPKLWAINTLVVTNLAVGDVISCSGVAFEKTPPNNWAKEAGALEWVFNASFMEQTLGSGMV